MSARKPLSQAQIAGEHGRLLGEIQTP